MKDLKTIENKIQNEDIQKFLKNAINLFELTDLSIDNNILELYSVYKRWENDYNEKYYVYVGHKENFLYFVEFKFKNIRTARFEYVLVPKFGVCYIVKDPEIKEDKSGIFCRKIGIYPDVKCKNTSICAMILVKEMTKNNFKDTIKQNNINIFKNIQADTRDIDFILSLENSLF